MSDEKPKGSSCTSNFCDSEAFFSKLLHRSDARWISEEAAGPAGKPSGLLPCLSFEPALLPLLLPPLLPASATTSKAAAWDSDPKEKADVANVEDAGPDVGTDARDSSPPSLTKPTASLMSICPCVFKDILSRTVDLRTRTPAEWETRAPAFTVNPA